MANRPLRNFKWTAERVETLQRDAAAGIPARDTAARLGTSLGSVRCARHTFKIEFCPAPPGCSPVVSEEVRQMREKIRRASISEALQRYHAQRRKQRDMEDDPYADAMVAKIERIQQLKKWEASQTQWR